MLETKQLHSASQCYAHNAMWEYHAYNNTSRLQHYLLIIRPPTAVGSSLAWVTCEMPSSTTAGQVSLGTSVFAHLWLKIGSK